MSTILSNKIRELVALAKETTNTDDATLYDCIVSLCNGYNGGANVPPNPLSRPMGALSARLSRLLAYANETTGQTDSTIEDAIHTLCDGYGSTSGKPKKYTFLINPGGAEMNTGIPIGNNHLSILTTTRYQNSATTVGLFNSANNYTILLSKGSGQYLRASNGKTTQTQSYLYHNANTEFTCDWYVDKVTINTWTLTEARTNQDKSVALANNINKLRYMKMHDESGLLIHDLYPTIIDGVAGLYDDITGEFHSSYTSVQYTVSD